jgi:alpha-1,3-rhamnosyl/mannosyltransferase
MSCGCPVLCSWSSSLPEVGGAAVAYFRTGDAADLARGLAVLLTDEKRRRAMSEEGVARAALFSSKRAATEILDLMRQGVSGLR